MKLERVHGGGKTWAKSAGTVINLVIGDWMMPLICVERFVPPTVSKESHYVEDAGRACPKAADHRR
jgi:hypothetical protein